MINKDTRPIGVFDSGLGGLTSVKELKQLLPGENIIYFGDTARVPYGSHDAETIIRFAEQDMRFLLSHDVKAVLIACGTASSTAMDHLKNMADIPVVGVVEPAAREASVKTLNKKIAVLATNATIKSHSYKRAIEKIDGTIQVVEKACPLFVPLVENGYIERDNTVTKLVVEDYLSELLLFGADTVILGCTHYPIIKDIITDYLGDVQVIEAGKSAAEYISEMVKQESNDINSDVHGCVRYFVSEGVGSFSEIGRIFLGEEIRDSVEKIYIEQY